MGFDEHNATDALNTDSLARHTVGPAVSDMQELLRANDAEHRMQRVHLVVLLGFVVLFAAQLFVRARTHRHMQMEQLRSRLSRDLHDDIGSTLSSINILSTVARRKAEAGDDVGAVASLSGISERTQRLMRNMSDIVWSVDPERDTLEELLARMREFGAAVLEPKGIELRFEACGDLEGSLPPALKSNLYLIYKEAVNNVAKHAQATEVSVSFSHANNRLHMTITDNGKAMEVDPGAGSAGGGNGLRNMRMRALEMKADLRIEGPSPQGTRIDLVLSL
jgi:signal transduction histidine kinase